MSNLTPVEAITPEEDSDEITCWCGAHGKYGDLFSDALETRCGGSGVVYCYCGGDLCVCHYHGEDDCLGCIDCEGADEDYDDEY